MKLTKRQIEILRLLNLNPENDIEKVEWIKNYEIHSIDKPKSIFNYSLMGDGKYTFAINPETFDGIRKYLEVKTYNQDRPHLIVYKISEKGEQHLKELKNGTREYKL
jgi:hypothetical protein